MRLLLLAPLLAAFGCVNPPERASTAALCYRTVYWGPESARAAAIELQRRGITDCSAINANAAQQRAADAAALGVAGALLSKPPAPTIAPPINCTSRTAGGQTYTTCQ